MNYLKKELQPKNDDPLVKQFDYSNLDKKFTYKIGDKHG